MPLTASWGPFALRLLLSPFSSLPPPCFIYARAKRAIAGDCKICSQPSPLSQGTAFTPSSYHPPSQGLLLAVRGKVQSLLAPCQGKTSFTGSTSGHGVSKAKGTGTAWLTILPSLWAPKDVRRDGAICFKHWDYVLLITEVACILKGHRRTYGLAAGCKKMLRFHRRHVSHCYQKHPQRFISLSRCLQPLPEHKMHFCKPARLIPSKGITAKLPRPKQGWGEKATAPSASLVNRWLESISTFPGSPGCDGSLRNHK